MTNYKDLGLKLFWSTVAFLAGAVGVAVAGPDMPAGAWWAVPVAMLAQLVLSFARQKVGATPPDIQGMPAEVPLKAVPDA